MNLNAEAVDIVAVLQQAFDRIDARLNYATTPPVGEVAGRLRARREQLEQELAEVMFAKAGVVVPRNSPF